MLGPDWVDYALDLMLKNGILYQPKEWLYQLTDKFQQSRRDAAMNLLDNHNIRSQIIQDFGPSPVMVARKAHELAGMVILVDYLGGVAKNDDIEKMYAILLKIQELGESGV